MCCVRFICLSCIQLLAIQSSMSDMQSVYSGSVMYAHEEVTGEIQMGVSYSDTDNTLKVSINKVRGLTPPNKIDEDHTNPYVAETHSHCNDHSIWWSLHSKC